MGGKRIGLWVVSGLVALTFVATGVGKLAAIPPSPENFTRWGLSMNFMRLIGVVEVVGGLALMVPRIAPLAALALGATMMGALKTGISFRETPHIVLPSLLLLLLAFICWRRLAK